jgi:hypothetical protein
MIPEDQEDIPASYSISIELCECSVSALLPKAKVAKVPQNVIFADILIYLGDQMIIHLGY